MITIRSARLVFITILMAISTCQPASAAPAGDIAALVASNTACAMDLYASLKTTDGNLFFSPYSISTCLAMTYAGARGNTAAQMAQTLHFNSNQERLAVSFGELQTQLNDEPNKNGIELSIANGLWKQKDNPFLPAFLDMAKQSFGANIEQADFRTRAESARISINDWVSNQTKGKITDLIQPGLLNQATRLVLVNAIYFKGRWAAQFDNHKTIKAPFSVGLTQKPEARLMNLTADFRYAEVEGLQLLELPYAGDHLSMDILLPHESGGLKGMEDQLNENNIDRWLAQTRERKVAVFLPKFKLAAQINLAKRLAEMGITDAFSPLANFSGMDGARDLFISAVVHKAFIDVDEEGIEAAAATGVAIRSMAVMMPQPIPIFRADHPFIFLIRDNHSGSILFLGRLADPTQS